jgi:hypothetical protein
MNRRIYPLFTFLAIISCLIFGILGCEKGKREGEKPQTIANKPLSDDAFKAEISVENPPITLKVNSAASMKVKIKNISNSSWPAKGQPDGKYPVHLAYHWIDKNGKMVVFDGLRTELPRDLGPNEDVPVNAALQAPGQAGEYVLEFDMVQEAVAWFAGKGSKTSRVSIKIE